MLIKDGSTVDQLNEKMMDSRRKTNGQSDFLTCETIDVGYVLSSSTS